MGPLNDENTLQVNENNNKNWKMYIINLKANRYKQSSSVYIIQSIPTYKLMGPVSILRLPKE